MKGNIRQKYCAKVEEMGMAVDGDERIDRHRRIADGEYTG